MEVKLHLPLKQRELSKAPLNKELRKAPLNKELSKAPLKINRYREKVHVNLSLAHN